MKKVSIFGLEPVKQIVQLHGATTACEVVFPKIQSSTKGNFYIDQYWPAERAGPARAQPDASIADVG